jgi:hypothetical protein
MKTKDDCSKYRLRKIVPNWENLDCRARAEPTTFATFPVLKDGYVRSRAEKMRYSIL